MSTDWWVDVDRQPEVGGYIERFVVYTASDRLICTCPSRELADAIISALSLLRGCSDHGCILRPRHLKGGMGTNGGCHCRYEIGRFLSGLPDSGGQGVGKAQNPPERTPEKS